MCVVKVRSFRGAVLREGSRIHPALCNRPGIDAGSGLVELRGDGCGDQDCGGIGLGVWGYAEARRRFAGLVGAMLDE